MSIQGTELLKNILQKESDKKGNNIFIKLSGTEISTVTGGQKKDNFSIQAELMEFLDPTAGLSDEEKSAYLEKIIQKLRSGKELSPEEMNYLRAKDPALYAQAARVQAMRENLKSQLKTCRSKEEVQKVYSDAVSMISKEDPMKEAIIAAYDDVLKEFRETGEYQALPERAEDDEHHLL